MKQSTYYLIYFAVEEDFVIILASEQLLNDITDKCSDDVLFSFVSAVAPYSVKYLFTKSGLCFKHKNEFCYMLPKQPVERIKELFGI